MTKTINELWDEFRKELNAVREGTTASEYADICCRENKIRGPHVRIMIPAETKTICPTCHQEVDHTVCSYPTNAEGLILLSLVNKYLCKVNWDGIIREKNYVGDIYNGSYYELNFDKVD